jgi:hypothetical protein
MQEYHIPSQFGSQEQKERKIVFFSFPCLYIYDDFYHKNIIINSTCPGFTDESKKYVIHSLIQNNSVVWLVIQLIS